MMTVKDIRKAIEGLPDDAPVLVKPHSQEEWATHDRRRVRDRETNVVTVIEAKPAPTWDYGTREIQNAYCANDDRFDQSTILLVELGDFVHC